MKKTVILFFLIYLPLSLYSSERVNFSIGYGDKDSKLYRLDVERYWIRNIHWLSNYLVLDFKIQNALAWWQGKATQKKDAQLLDVSVTPVLQVESSDIQLKSFRPFLELGLGVHLLSNNRIGERDLSSNFQFGSHLGIGMLFGEKRLYHVVLAIHHISNGGLKAPNLGINFLFLRFGLFF